MRNRGGSSRWPFGMALGDGSFVRGCSRILGDGSVRLGYGHVGRGPLVLWSACASHGVSGRLWSLEGVFCTARMWWTVEVVRAGSSRRRPHEVAGAGVIEASSEGVVPRIDPLPAVMLVVPVGDSVELRGQLPVIVAPLHLELALAVGQDDSAEGIHPLPEPCGVGLGVELRPPGRGWRRAQLPVDCVSVVDVVARGSRRRHRASLSRRGVSTGREGGVDEGAPLAGVESGAGLCGRPGAGVFGGQRRVRVRGRRSTPFSGGGVPTRSQAAAVRGWPGRAPVRRWRGCRARRRPGRPRRGRSRLRSRRRARTRETIRELPWCPR